MISKHISCKPKNDNYKRLANYIADASHGGEKCLMSWCVNCEGSDNEYSEAIDEVVDIQSLNMRSEKEKTYHLLVSLRLEDEGKLQQDDFKIIEEQFAKALGYDDHQRHCGVHINTENLHMHIAYNMVHPKKLTRHEPFRDYYILSKVCRELEQKYNLTIDNGIEQKNENNKLKLSSRSATKESLTGEESFERYLMNSHDKLMELIDKSKIWEDVHHAFALYGLEIKQRANGLAIKNHKGKQSIKASAFDREISHKNMVQRLGIYAPVRGNYKAKDWYMKKPLQTDFSNELWTEFIKESRMIEIEAIKEKWYREKVRITGLAVSRKNRFDLLKRARLRESMEINQFRQKLSLNHQNWLDFLRNKALTGNEKALEILQNANYKPLLEHISAKNYNKFLELLKSNHEKQKNQDEIYSSFKSHKTKKHLTAISFFKNIYDKAFTYSITRNGSIVFKLENGEKIIDEGYNVKHTTNARDIAEEYFKEKLGIRQIQKNEQKKGISR